MALWKGISPVKGRKYTCGHCGSLVGSTNGFPYDNAEQECIYICPVCLKPSFVTPSGQIPGIAPGNPVQGLPPDVNELYNEARRCVAASAYTGAVLLCRKLLMNTAAAKGAGTNLSFQDYVQYLADKGYVPPGGESWVDHIRRKGNEATHEIAAMSKEDAEELIIFLEMLLKFIYEFPSRIPPRP